MRILFSGAIAAVLMISGPDAKPAGTPIWVESSVSCGLWAKARASKGAQTVEAFLTAFLNGYAIGSNTEFWRANGRQLSTDSVYLWMDRFCDSNPLENIYRGSYLLFTEQTKKPSR